MRRRVTGLVPAVAVAATVASVGLAACGTGERNEPSPITDGSSEQGRLAIERYGCGTCHVVPGVRGANGLVGPPLERFGRRMFIAGQLPNNQANLIRWITDPEAVEPGTAMPDLGVSPTEARDIAAYLLELR